MSSQANTLDEIRDSHTMKLVPLSQRELFWFELEPQIQALITEARIDELKRLEFKEASGYLAGGNHIIRQQVVTKRLTELTKREQLDE